MAAMPVGAIAAGGVASAPLHRHQQLGGARRPRGWAAESTSGQGFWGRSTVAVVGSLVASGGPGARVSPTRSSSVGHSRSHHAALSVGRGDSQPRRMTRLGALADDLAPPLERAPEVTGLPGLDRQGRVMLKNLTMEELEDFMESVGEERKRAKQVWRWMYKPGHMAASVGDMSDVARACREKLDGVATLDSGLELHEKRTDAHGTTKLTFRIGEGLPGAGGVVETVVIGMGDRITLCVSSQLGCALNCQFCFTGRMGLQGNLTAAQIIDQVVSARRMYEQDLPPSERLPIKNIVFMGMGEPLHNVDNVLRAAACMLDPHGLGFGSRKVTISTSGLVPAIRRFGEECGAQLAVSLNATTDEIRDWIMPVNRRWDLEELLGTLREIYPKGGREGRPHGHHVLLEYILLKGVNDTPEDAERLIEIAGQIECKINLIQFNPHPGTEFQPLGAEEARAFAKVIRAAGVVATLRESKGDEEMAACGQLGAVGGDARAPPRLPPPDRLKDLFPSRT